MLSYARASDPTKVNSYETKRNVWDANSDINPDVRFTEDGDSLG